MKSALFLSSALVAAASIDTPHLAGLPAAGPSLVYGKPAWAGAASGATGAVAAPPICSHHHHHGHPLMRRPESHAVPEASPWTHIGPCYRNGTTGAEYCAFTAGDYAGGRGLSVITTPDRAGYVASLPGFADPAGPATRQLLEGHNLDPPKVRVAALHGKGFGLVATERIWPGERIFAETASVMVDYDAWLGAPREQFLDMHAAAVWNLPARHRAQYLNMSTHGVEDLSFEALVEKVQGINAFDVSLEDDAKAEMLHTVFAQTARVNHDCRANVDYYFDARTLTQHTTAIKTIFPGEELTISYIEPLMTRAKRQARLFDTWGFRCSCAACTSPPIQVRASDARVRQALELRRELRDWSTGSRATPQMAELLVSLYEQERLSGGSLADPLALLALEWNGAGEPWLAVRAARRALQEGITGATEWDRDMSEMAALAEDPFRHWSWQLRTRKRMGWGTDEEDEENR